MQLHRRKGGDGGAAVAIITVTWPQSAACGPAVQCLAPLTPPPESRVMKDASMHKWRKMPTQCQHAHNTSTKPI